MSLENKTYVRPEVKSAVLSILLSDNAAASSGTEGPQGAGRKQDRRAGSLPAPKKSGLHSKVHHFDLNSLKSPQIRYILISLPLKYV